MNFRALLLVKTVGCTSMTCQIIFLKKKYCGKVKTKNYCRCLAEIFGQHTSYNLIYGKVYLLYELLSDRMKIQLSGIRSFREKVVALQIYPIIDTDNLRVVHHRFLKKVCGIKMPEIRRF